MSRYILFFKAKQQQKLKNRVAKRKVARKWSNRWKGGCGLPRPWGPLPARLCWFPNAAFWCLFWSVGFATVCPCWVILDLSRYLLWSSRPQKHLLILWFRLVILKSKKTLKTSKTTNNRRNRDINRITIHFNPLK